MKVSRVNEMREMDRRAIDAFGIPEAILMENAGHAAFQWLAGQFGIRERRTLILCGGGNNGGDGLVVARKVHSAGGAVEVILLSSPEKYAGAAAMNWESVRKLGLPARDLASISSLARSLETADQVVDAIFGTGLDRTVEGRYREAIEAVNAAGKPVLSLDIPSGVHGDTGQIMGVAMKAKATVTFGLPKIGNLLYPGAARGGKLGVTHISFPPRIYDAEELKLRINHPPALPPRDPDGHKGGFGDVLFIAGSGSYYGAPYLSAMAFLKSGGGYARLAAPRSIIPVIGGMGPEMVFVPQSETPGGAIAAQNLERLLDMASRADFVVMGPGLSLDEETQGLVRELVPEIPRPLLLDGDAIAAVSNHPELLKNREAETILTPHPGEMSRLAGKPVEAVVSDRIGVLTETARSLNAIIVLKGAHSQIGDPEGRVAFNLSGNSGMGTAGSGDVLAGTVAGMAGLGMTPAEAVEKGVFLHGLAGDLAAESLGPDGMTARDVLESLPGALRLAREDSDGTWTTRYRIPVIV
jgi:NAD(P)H-hydrate epimerase